MKSHAIHFGEICQMAIASAQPGLFLVFSAHCEHIFDALITAHVDYEGLVSAELGRSEKNQDQLLDSLRGFTSALSLGRKTVREGESLVIETKHYYATGAVEKNLYLGVIIYIAARQCSVPITLYEIASCIGRPHRELIQKYR